MVNVDEMSELREEMARTRRGVEDQNQILSRSPLVGARSRCDLTEHLLEPFERAPRPPSGGAAVTPRDEEPVRARDVEENGDVVMTIDGSEFARVARKALHRHGLNDVFIE